jgi:tetratricopeptide (TPR) repeat protein
MGAVNPPRTRRRAVAALLFLVAAAVFARALGGGFVFDDEGYVLKNRHVAGGLTLAGARWAFTTFTMANWHPLAWLSHQLDAALWGLAPAGHHLTSILLHAASTAVLFLLLRALTGAFGPSLAAAALFGLHPLRVESVAWVAERKDVLSLLLLLLALDAWRRHLARPAPARYAAAVVLYAASLLAKPTGVTLPLLLLLLDWWPLGRWRALRERAGALAAALRLAAEKAPFLLLAAASSALTLAAQRAGGAVGSLEAYPPGTRAANALWSAAAYLGQTAWPAGLSPFYPHPGAGLPAWKTAAALLLLLAATGLALFRSRRAPWLATGWLWYLATLVPVIGIVQVGWQARADRYTYLPSIGLAVALAWEGAALVAGRPRARRALVAAVAALLAASASVTWIQTGYWRDGLTLFGHVLERDPGNWLARTNHGRSLLERGRWPEAEREFREAIRLNPGNSLAHTNLGVVLRDEGRPVEAEAALREAVRLEPDSFDAQAELGKLLNAVGHPGEGLGHLEEASRLVPESADARLNLGVSLFLLGRPAEALPHFREANRLDPDLFEALLDSGAALSALGREREALPWLEAATRARPGHAIAQYDLGSALERLGRRDEAAAAFRRALVADPALLKARVGLARVAGAP